MGYNFVAPPVKQPVLGNTLQNIFGNALNTYMQLEQFKRLKQKDKVDMERSNAYADYMEMQANKAMSDEERKQKALQQQKELQMVAGNIRKDISDIQVGNQFDFSKRNSLNQLKNELYKKYPNHTQIVDLALNPQYDNIKKLEAFKRTHEGRVALEKLRYGNLFKLAKEKSKSKSGTGNNYGFTSGVGNEIKTLQAVYSGTDAKGKPTTMPAKTAVKYIKTINNNQKSARALGKYAKLSENTDLISLALSKDGGDVFVEYNPRTKKFKNVAANVINILKSPENDVRWMDSKVLEKILGRDRVREFGKKAVGKEDFRDFYNSLTPSERKKTREAVSLNIDMAIAKAKSLFRKVGVPENVIKKNEKMWREHSMLGRLDLLEKPLSWNEKYGTSFPKEFWRGVGGDVAKGFKTAFPTPGESAALFKHYSSDKQ